MPHHEDDDLAENTTEFLRRKREAAKKCQFCGLLLLSRALHGPGLCVAALDTTNDGTDPDRPVPEYAGGLMPTEQEAVLMAARTLYDVTYGMSSLDGWEGLPMSVREAYVRDVERVIATYRAALSMTP